MRVFSRMAGINVRTLMIRTSKHSQENVQKKVAASAYSTNMLLVPIFSEQSSSTGFYIEILFYYH
jgi:hypothetical protein